MFFTFFGWIGLTTKSEALRLYPQHNDLAYTALYATKLKGNTAVI